MQDQTRAWRGISQEATEGFGERLGEALKPKDFLGLTGPLGAGKTLLVHGIVRGLARALGVEAWPRVCSPSYTIINSYRVGPLRVHHVDLYRLRDIDDLESTGYWDAVEDKDGVMLVEWLDHIEGAAPPQGATAHISLEDPTNPLDCPRLLSIRGEGSLATRLRAALEGA